MSKSDMTLYRFHLAARNASDAALLAWWMDQADEYSNLHHENTEKHLHEAAAILGYDLVKRQSEAA